MGPRRENDFTAYMQDPTITDISLYSCTKIVANLFSQIIHLRRL
jgi:hypothetical protein